MVDRKQRPIVPTEHADEREHRRLLAIRASASFPKDGTEGMAAPVKLQQLTAAQLVGDYAANLWAGSHVYVSDEGVFATSDGSNWIRSPGDLPISLANGGTGAALADPNADRIFFWDDSAGQTTFLRPNTGLAISGTDLNLSTPVTVANGGTGQTTEAEALGEMTQALTEDTSPDRTADFFMTYDASADTAMKVAYKNVNPWTTVNKTADETLTANTTLQDDNHLLFAVAANTKYAWRGVLHVNTPAAADFKLTFTGPSSPTVARITTWGVDSGAAIAGSLELNAFANVATFTGGAADWGIQFYGVLQNGANAGTVTLQWAQNSSSGTTTVYAGSYLEWMVVA